MTTQTMIFSEGALHVLAEDEAAGDLTEERLASTGASGITLGRSDGSREIPYMYLIFNDVDLYEQADRIEVSIDRGEVIHEIIPEEQGIILLYGESEMKEEYNSYEVTVYDSENQILYKS